MYSVLGKVHQVPSLVLKKWQFFRHKMNKTSETQWHMVEMCIHFNHMPLQVNWSDHDFQLNLCQGLKTFSAMPTHTMNIVAHFIEIPPLSKQILCRTKYVLTDEQTNRQSENNASTAYCWWRQNKTKLLPATNVQESTQRTT